MLNFGSANPIDPSVYNSSEINQLKPDFGAGIWIYSARYFMGLSVQQMIPQKIYYSDDQLKADASINTPHFFATAGYRFLLGDDISALPSVMLKYIQPVSPQLDINNTFALFFNEKRPFFLEGADLFETPFPAVYTRTIAAPDVGVKLTGKEGHHGGGVFIAQDAKTNLLMEWKFDKRQ